MVNTEYVLFGVKIGDEDWQEVVISTNRKHFDKAKVWATANGYNRFRIAIIDLSKPPDFRRTINKAGDA